MREYVQAQLDRLKAKEVIEIPEIESLLLQTYKLLDSEEEPDYNLCLAIICHIADADPRDVMVRQLLYDCVIKSRVFLYNNLLKERIKNFDPHVSVQDNIAESFYTSSKTKTILTRPQKIAFDLYQHHKRLVLSAPTSFGKTRIVREIIAQNNYKNIALILPTVSLLSEQFQELRSNIKGYVISKSSKVDIRENKKYILILTPERMNVFMEEHPDFHINFFVMDEIYKADYKLEDGRFRVFADILYRLAKTDADFYLIGPYINFSEKFRKRFDVEFKLFNLEIVQKDYYRGPGTYNVNNSTIRIISSDKFKSLLRIISSESIDGKFLIYRCTKQLVEETARKLVETWPVSAHNIELASYLSEIVSPDWDLVSCIKRGVAFHHGAMPRFIQELVVDEFNEPSGGVNYLFCTTSLTEGVNTSAKNVILYDKKIAGAPLKGLDKKNIEGRAGRFMKHFIGRVFHLEDIDETNDDNMVELEYFDNDNPAAETLIQIDNSDLTNNNLLKKEAIRKKLLELDIPYDIIKANKFVSIEGQTRLIQLLRQDNGAMINDHSFSGGMPSADISKRIFSTIYENLFTDNDRGRDFKNGGKNVLLGLTNIYLFKDLTFSQILNLEITKSQRNNVNTRIRYTFNLISKYFEFIWPRYLKAYEKLYNFVAISKGFPTINLDVVIAKLEYGTIKDHEIILKDAGLPNEIIRKISRHFDGCKTFEDIQSKKITAAQQISSSTNNIERKILNRYI